MAGLTPTQLAAIQELLAFDIAELNHINELATIREAPQGH